MTQAMSVTSKPVLAPGPRIPGAMVKLVQLSPFAIRQDQLKLNYDMMKQYGSVVCMHVGSILIYFITEPDLIHEMLVQRPEDFRKAQLLRDSAGWMMGNGLLTSDGEFWKRQRKLAQPAFHHKRIEAYGTTMVEYTAQMLETWKSKPSIDLFNEMMALTLRIVNKTLFNVDLTSQVERIGALMTTILAAANDKLEVVPTLADKLAVFKRRREQQALADINAIIKQIIEEHRQAKSDSGDLLTMLLEARDENDQPMPEQQLQDEVMTLFVAGHETSANGLTWALYLLATHPEVEAKLRQEIKQVLGGRPPTIADLAQMPYGEMVVKETMRLYPPAGGVTREPIHDTQLGGYLIPAGTLIGVSTYAMHRNPKFFPDPEAFDPERFSKEREAAIPKYAYLPFGGGPRVCIGNSFAMMEIRLAIATILQRYQLTVENKEPVTAEQQFTIRPKQRIVMRVNG
ncbi:MAG: cytochrome P450 [Anaerolineae bacterium]|nr:cytochrome P450 [Anaerolineae bacterium]